MNKLFYVILVSALALLSFAEDDSTAINSECPLKSECTNMSVNTNGLMATRTFDGAMQLNGIIEDATFLASIGLDEASIAKIKASLGPIKEKEKELKIMHRNLSKTRAELFKQLEGRNNDGSLIKEVNAKLENVMCDLNNLQIDKFIIVRDNLTDKQMKAILRKVNPQRLLPKGSATPKRRLLLNNSISESQSSHQESTEEGFNKE